MGCGIPVIASAVGMNTTVVDDGVNGFLVRVEDQWMEKLSQLIENSILRESLGRKGRIKAESEFSIQKKHAVLLSVLTHE